MMKNKFLRALLPAVLIIIWLTVGSLGGPTFSKISEVATNDRASFLPSSAESTQVQKLQSEYENGRAIPAIIIIESKNVLTADDVRTYAALNKKISEVEDTEGTVIGPIPSEGMKALQFIAPIKTDVEMKEVVEELRTVVSKDLPDGVVSYVAGPAGLAADLSKAFNGIDGILLLVALTAVFIILLIVYRSLLLPFLVLFNAIFALCAAILVVFYMAKNGIIELNGQSQGILFILVIGAATDYSLLLVARYKEALSSAADKWQAMRQGIRGSVEPIVASAATVILALLCLLFSDLNSNRALGPIAATGIAFSLLATLTFLPALLLAFGKVAFWPSKLIKSNKQNVKIKDGSEELAGIWKKVGRLIITKPRTTWVVIVVVLAAASLGLLGLKASGVPQTEIILVPSNAVDGQKAIARHYNAGIGAPVNVAVPDNSVNKTADLLAKTPEIGDVKIYGDRGPTANLDDAKIIDNKALLSATLNIDPYSNEAERLVTELRENLHNEVPGVMVGGTTALDIDTSNTGISDLKKIIPLVLLVIFIVLAILLRALVAPLILILTVVLSFAATLGISALVFNNILGFAGADAAVPLFGFVFLVALGVDYNIFLISRTREEAFRYGTKAAILHSLGKTGGVITSAGIVLAATFAALGVIPILFLAQLAFIVAFGVLLDTIIVRSLLVPAIFDELGDKVWWPSKLKK